MPGREIPLVNNEVYHIFNRGIASMPIFLNKRGYQRALEIIFYYQNSNLPMKYSKFLKMSLADRAELLDRLRVQQKWLVDVICYCLMSNHFHFLLRQKENNGISKFISNFTNSYTRYFNTKEERIGPIVQGKFKSVRIETEEQLLHVSRYIHLNPYTGYIVKTFQELEEYPYSSFPEYIGKSQTNLCRKDLILSQFKHHLSYKQFVFDNASYQRELHKIKHLILE